MNVNNYECPKCHNVFPESNKLMHDIRCTVNNPVPLNQSRIFLFEENNNQNKTNNRNRNNINNRNQNNLYNQIQTIPNNRIQNNINIRNQNNLNNRNHNNINNRAQSNINNRYQNNQNQHLPQRPQPRLGLRNNPISHIDIFHNIRESFMDIPQTFDCWLCGQTLPEDQKIDHMLCHQIQNENEENERIEQNNLNQNQGQPLRNQRLRDRLGINYHNNNRRQQQRNNNQSPQIVRNNQMAISNANFHARQEYNNPQNNNRNRNNLVVDIPSFRNEDIFHNRLNQLRLQRNITSLNNVNNRRRGDNVRLPVSKIDNVSLLDPEKRNCSICLCDFITGDKVTTLPCIHMYHSACIEKWLRHKDFCPLCKMKISDAI